MGCLLAQRRLCAIGRVVFVFGCFPGVHTCKLQLQACNTQPAVWFMGTFPTCIPMQLGNARLDPITVHHSGELVDDEHQSGNHQHVQYMVRMNKSQSIQSPSRPSPALI